jgi:hypothetical protein
MNPVLLTEVTETQPCAVIAHGPHVSGYLKQLDPIGPSVCYIFIISVSYTGSKCLKQPDIQGPTNSFSLNLA